MPNSVSEVVQKNQNKQQINRTMSKEKIICYLRIVCRDTLTTLVFNLILQPVHFQSKVMLQNLSLLLVLRILPILFRKTLRDAMVT